MADKRQNVDRQDVDEIPYLLAVLRDDKPTTYMYVRAANDLRSAVRMMGKGMLEKYAVSQREYDRFMINAVYAQACSIVDELYYEGALSQPVLADPGKLMAVLEQFDLDPSLVTKIRSTIYRLAGTGVPYNEVVLLLKDRSVGVSDMTKCIVGCLDERGEATVGYVLQAMARRWPGRKRASAVKQLNRVLAVLQREASSKITIRVLGAKSLGDDRTISVRPV